MIGINIEMPTYCYDCPCHNGENGQCNVTGEYTFDKRPFDCPLCDVGEVRHGKFVSELVKKPDWAGRLQSYYQPNSCNQCHSALSGEENYCPVCGAKMEK